MLNVSFPCADARPPIVALMGPTASGKTALGIVWAQRWDGEIVSVDSALVYRGLDIGSAKPTAAERAAAPHHLLDLREPTDPFSAADFAIAARAAIEAILARGRVPLLVGGTGLYFRALLDGLSELPASDPALRASLNVELQQRGLAELHAELQQVDPVAAERIHRHDPQRVLRALEVWRSSGRPLSDWQRADSSPQRLPWRVLRLALAPPRALLHQRIEQRFDVMLEAGLLGEVERLLADPAMHRDLPALRAVGYRQAAEFLRGEVDRTEFRQRALAATRQLAKRQFTWLRAEPAAFWLDPVRDLRSRERLVAAHLQR